MKKTIKLNLLMGLTVCFALSTIQLVNATNLSSSYENATTTSESNSSISDTQTSESSECTDSTETIQFTNSTVTTDSSTEDKTTTTTENDSDTPVMSIQATSLRTSPVDPYQSYGQYVTIKSNNYYTYNNFSWNARHANKNLTGMVM